jgi:hypothetical protein
MPKAVPKKKKSEGVPLAERLRRMLFVQKLNNPRWLKSKHHGSRHYESRVEIKARRKKERLNRRSI